jgi:type I restriction enzyme M protein
MTAAEACEWGLWTNGLERFFLRREKRRFEVRFSPYGDWPMADGTMSTPDVHAETYVRPGDENALRRAFQRCHNFKWWFWCRRNKSLRMRNMGEPGRQF